MAVGLVGLSACGSSGSEPPESPPQDECTVGEPRGCSHASGKCGRARAACEAGTPATLGACICEAPNLVRVGPNVSYVDNMDVGAFGADAFYWAEYHFIPASAYTAIVRSAFGQHGEELVAMVPGLFSRMRVTEDTLYVDAYDLYAFTLSGEPLPEPAEEVAFPTSPTPPRVRTDETGLYVDGQKIDEEAYSFSVVEDGVFYVPLKAANYLKFAPFDASESPTVMASTPYSSDGSSLFLNVWASGPHFYVTTMAPDRTTLSMSYGDRSIIGQ